MLRPLSTNKHKTRLVSGGCQRFLRPVRRSERLVLSTFTPHPHPPAPTHDSLAPPHLAPPRLASPPPLTRHITDKDTTAIPPSAP
ncbi:hypothetical protein E2C01_095617 [Portunus trituberculatus]|uniref:Uncharacterized protein n=1 Tax=Portunus trituberculatus TaxID=210409 RepID=A0A5B7JTG4_PORTR|nr:hypothetical protein [Portunus trituberculatus]